METAHGLVQRAEDSSAERDGLGVTSLDAVYKEKARKMVLMDTAHRIVRRPEANLSPEGGGLGVDVERLVVQQVYEMLQRITKNDDRLVQEVVLASQTGFRCEGES